MTRYYSPRVSAEASRLGVALDRLTGTGAGGRVSVADVHRAAGAAGPRARTSPAYLARATFVMDRRSWINPGASVRIDAFAANPWLDELRQVRSSLPAGQPPTLFGTGDLPLFTSSGIDPQLLAKLPYAARHAAARADAQEVQQIFQRCAPPAGASKDAIEAAVAEAEVGYGGDRALVEYRDRFNAWLWADRA